MLDESVGQLINELFEGKFEKKFTVDDIERVLEQENVWLLTHEEDGKVVAMLTLYVVGLFSRKLGVIEEVVTSKEYRNRGIGSNLVLSAIDKARNLGCNCIELTVREDKPKVKKFYEHLGFKDRSQRAMRMLLTK